MLRKTSGVQRLGSLSSKLAVLVVVVLAVLSLLGVIWVCQVGYEHGATAARLLHAVDMAARINSPAVPSLSPLTQPTVYTSSPLPHLRSVQATLAYPPTNEPTTAHSPSTKTPMQNDDHATSPPPSDSGIDSAVSSTRIADSHSPRPVEPTPVTPGPTTVDVFIFAHPDDWILFMGEIAYDVLHSEGTAVFICLTAGDAGRGDAFWMSREEAMLAAIRTALPQKNGTVVNETEGDISVIDNFKRIHYHKIAQHESYFLRFPDGMPNGVGLHQWGYQSLSRIATGEIPAIATVVDMGNVFSRDDILAIMRNIVQTAQRGKPIVTLHLLDAGTHLRSTHADHMASRDLALMAVGPGTQQTCMHMMAHEDYRIQYRLQNLFGLAEWKKDNVFRAYQFVMNKFKLGECCSKIYFAWLLRSYFTLSLCPDNTTAVNK